MKLLKEKYIPISTVLAFALIPLSGFATDIYLPSFPAMAKLFGTSQADIQLSLVVFVVSGGISQLFVGSLVDRFGRYWLTLASLFIFAVSCLVIALSHSLGVILAMRVIQGITVALIVVSKRAFFMDVYAGDKLKNYTSLLSIVWATAPIAAPFIGGFLHHYFGWTSNFYFLGGAALLLIVLELLYSGETAKELRSFNSRSLLNAYSSKLSTVDFALTPVILGLTFSMVIMFNMVGPFIVEQVFHLSAVATGYCSLLSGVAIMIGGMLSKSTMHKSIYSKMTVAGSAFLVLSIALISMMTYSQSLYAMMGVIFMIHVFSGFTFNTFFAYALSRFSKDAGIVSGLTGGGTYLVTSLVSYSVTNLLTIKDPLRLGVGYLIISVLLVTGFVFFVLARRAVTSEDKVESNQALAVTESRVAA